MRRQICCWNCWISSANADALICAYIPKLQRKKHCQDSRVTEEILGIGARCKTGVCAQQTPLLVIVFVLGGKTDKEVCSITLLNERLVLGQVFLGPGPQPQKGTRVILWSTCVHNSKLSILSPFSSKWQDVLMIGVDRVSGGKSDTDWE
ncbi:uncharacterized protein VP01_4904g1 [Puccinia sorghi]|uniref:Uncharacterized protein n=1 Tax=Puccinia sorghi TaxID=27349 RepID=A0A0L6UM53_9BASI|nr:uncharacterized protein VP01_4904g1 [Puccinia sorghi]